MIKKILPVLIGAALVGGMSSSAIADVTAMGHIDTSFNSGKNKNRSGDTLNNLVCTTCSFGFKGSEDLGNGLSAIFKIDFQYETTERNADGALTDRDQWLGMNSNWGKLRIGTISTVYKSHGAMLDPVYRTAVQGRDWGLQSNLHTGAGDLLAQGRAENTVRYDSPTFAGFQAAMHYTVQTETDLDSSANSPWGIGGQWKAGGFLVFADYITSDIGGDDDAWKVGGRWGFDKFALFGQYEGDGGAISGRTSLLTDAGLIEGQDIKGNGDGADTWFIGGTAGFGNNLIYAAYGQQSDGKSRFVTGDFEGDRVSTKYDAWSIVGVHSMSKRTKLYVGYNQTDYDKLDKINDFSLGMKHTF
jgi:predicted porin